MVCDPAVVAEQVALCAACGLPAGVVRDILAGALWADIPSRYSPYTTCVNRFNWWRKAGVSDRLLDAVPEGHC